MYNLLIAAGAALIVLLLCIFGFSLKWGGALLAMTVFGVVYVVLVRLTMKKVMEVIETAGKDLQAQRFEKAIRSLKEALRYGKWQIYVEAQINSQIGSIYYIRREFNNAFPYLEKSFFKQWSSMAMLAICYMKRQKRDLMISTFEKAVQWSPKEPLLWNIYAYCLNECSETTRAREVLEKGLKKLPGDAQIRENLEALADGKKMKMRSYGEMWFQFHLESMAAIQKHQMSSMAGAAGGVRMPRRKMGRR